MYFNVKQGNHAIYERQGRLRKIQKILKEAKEKAVEVSYTRFRGELGLVFGLSNRKIDEYMQQLLDSEAISVIEKEGGEKIIEYVKDALK